MQRNKIQKACCAILFSIFLTDTLQPILAAEIVDYQHHLSSQFPRRVRKETRFIIIHSTESSLPSALRTLSRGKVQRGQHVTRGGHAHYLVAKNGTIYRILGAQYCADHAGVSMWNGLENLNDYSIGIELEGYHNVPFKKRQYQSLKGLLNILKKRYALKDRDVLEHYRIAYSTPNRYHLDKCRGRKSDPGINNFDRLRAGLKDEYSEDPDVIAGRIHGIPNLMRAAGHSVVQGEDEEPDGNASEPSGSNIITAHRTAWRIAGNQYKAASTLYKFPGGTSRRGDQIQDWANLPAGTEVRMGVAEEREKKVVNVFRAEVVVPQITATSSPWRVANALFNSSFTFYIYPDGSVRQGNTISEGASVPLGTKLLVAYRQIPRPRTKNKLGEDMGNIYLDPRTLYLLPKGIIKSGDQIEDFTKIPIGTLVFAKLE